MVLRIIIAALTVALWIRESGADLTAAYLAGDRTEVDRPGECRGAAGLRTDLGSPDRLTVLTAIAAASAADDGWALLAPLAARANEPDRSIASRAARAAADIAGSLDRELMITHEAPPGPMRDVMADWLRIAFDADRWPDVRVRALEVASSLSQALGPDGIELNWIQSISDDDPEMRRAALELAPTPISDDIADAAGKVLESDPSDDVAGVAGQILCDSLRERAWKQVQKRLGRGGMARIRKIAAATGQPSVVRAALADCLRADGSKESKAVLSKLNKVLPSHLKRGRR